MSHHTSTRTHDKPLRLCVTGGAGFIGSHLTDALLAAGHHVTVLDDLSSGREANVPSAASFEMLDIRGAEAARIVERGKFDALLHQAAQMNVRASLDDVRHDAEVNILGSLNLLEAARLGGVRRVLFASTGGAIYGEQDVFPAPEDHPLRPASPYGVAKLAVERYLAVYHQTYGLDVTCLRYANVYGPRQNPHGEAGVIAIFLQKLLAGVTPTINGDGLQTRDYVDVADVVRANLAALATPSGARPGYRVYNVGTGVETNVVDLYARITAALGRNTPPIHGPAKAGEQQRSCVDARRLQEDLGVPEPVSLSAGLTATVEWFRQQAT